MVHRFEKVDNAEYTLVLLHGTGGNENDLIPFAKQMSQDKNILALRGNINENGMLRFFRRKAEGVYDLEDLEARTVELGKFIQDASVKYSFDPDKIILLGFSNGANIATHLLLHKDFNYKYGALLSPLYPLEFDVSRKLVGYQFFVSAGKFDPICPPEASQALLDNFRRLGVDLKEVWGDSHNINQEIALALQEWLQSF